MNVVLVILDSLRKDHLGAYGNPWIKTPNIDALAKESMRFERAYPESMPTIPARRAIHTGLRSFPFRNWERWSDDFGLYGWQPIPETQTTLAEILGAQGYQTLFVTDTYSQFAPYMNFHRGFGAYQFIRGQKSDPYRPQTLCPEKKMKRSLIGGDNPERAERILRQYFANTLGRKREEDWFAPQVFSNAAELLGAAEQDKPFFMVVDSFDPHEPWDPPEKYISLYDDGYVGPEVPTSSSYGSSSYLTERQLERMRALYSAEITMADRWLGNFLDKMSELSLMENTLLLLISDHGHALGEHGIVGKLPSQMYPELTDIVFLIRHPEGKGSGKTSDFYASTHDVAPTVLGAALGIEPPVPMDGQDLTVLLEGGNAEPRKHFSLSYHDHVWARDDRYVMASRNDGAEARLYDLRSDPKMDRDIASSKPKLAEQMFSNYVLSDAGGSLPRY